MKIMVCLKQVPHQDARLDIDSAGTWIQESNIKFEINTYDTYALEEALKDQGKTLADVTVAIQGFGNVGSHAARLIAERGGRIVAVADHMGAVSNETGLEVDEQAFLANRFPDYRAQLLGCKRLLEIVECLLLERAHGDVDARGRRHADDAEIGIGRANLLEQFDRRVSGRRDVEHYHLATPLLHHSDYLFRIGNAVRMVALGRQEILEFDLGRLIPIHHQNL